MRVVGHLDDEAVTRVARAAGLRTLEDVLAWVHACGGALVDIIVQDEYTHDVTVQMPGVVYLAFDST